MKLTTLLSITTLLLYFTSIQADNLPEMGNPVNSKLTLKQESIIGREFYRNMQGKDYVLNDPETASYLRHIGNTLVNHLDDVAQSFTFFLVKAGAINAFATPGGYIGVNAGLVAATRSEDELAGVIAHEIAHVHQRHIARRLMDMQSVKTLSLASLIAGIIAASHGYGQGASALLYGGAAAQQQLAINFTRENEIDADRIGIRLLTAANYAPQGIVDFFKILQRKKNNKQLTYLQHLLTHPLDRIRISEAENRIAQLDKNRVSISKSNDDYFYMHTRIDTLNSNDFKNLLKRRKKENDKTIYGLYKLAQAYEVNKKWQAASVIYKKLLKKENKMPFTLGLCRSYIQLKKPAQTINILEKNLKTQPDNFALNIYYAEALLSNQQAGQAIRQLNKILRKQENITPDIYRLLFNAYQNNQQNYLAQKTQVEYLYQKGNYTAAINLLRGLIEKDQTESIEKKILQVRLKQIISTQKTVKELNS